MALAGRPARFFSRDTVVAGPEHSDLYVGEVGRFATVQPKQLAELARRVDREGRNREEEEEARKTVTRSI